MILGITLGIALLWGRPVLWITARETKPVPVLPTSVKEAFNKAPSEIQLAHLALEPIESPSEPSLGADRALDAGAPSGAPRLVQTDPPFL